MQFDKCRDAGHPSDCLKLSAKGTENWPRKACLVSSSPLCTFRCASVRCHIKRMWFISVHTDRPEPRPCVLSPSLGPIVTTINVGSCFVLWTGPLCEHTPITCSNKSRTWTSNGLPNAMFPGWCVCVCVQACTFMARVYAKNFQRLLVTFFLENSSLSKPSLFLHLSSRLLCTAGKYA